jgi:lysophospholipase L1-like esterase
MRLQALARLSVLALLAASAVQAQPMGSGRPMSPLSGNPASPHLAKYVSLGSSYAAGPGVGQRNPDGGGCARSLSNYAHILARRHHLQLVDAACSGATTRNILSERQDGFAPQIEAVSPDTRLVTITIGGNDVDYVGELQGLACRDTGGSNCKVASDQEIDARFAALPASLREVVAQVHRRAPAARVVLIGYLAAVPEHARQGCAAVPLSPPDLKRMQDIYGRLARAIGSAAADTGSAIVRSSVISDGHDACSSQPFVAGVHPPTTPGWSGPVAYHPNQAGMDRLADAIDDALSGGRRGS